jgi:4,5-dihydroxyphthalate decarboxylase
LTDSIEVTVSGGDYEHTLGIDGFSANGVRVRYARMPVRQIFEGMLESRRFEACEFSLANYITLRGNGNDWLTAIPSFPYRAFRHGLAVTRRDSGITSLSALENTRIGVEDYSMTAAVWFRGILSEHYGVDLDSIRWVTRAKQRFELPAGARVEKTSDDLEGLLVDGSIDVLLGFNLKDSASPVSARRLRTVVADPEAEEQAYFERTGVYPIMHVVVIRNDVLEKHPGAAEAVSSAYAAAKARAYQRQLGATLVPWGKSYWTRTFERFGGDPLPYGLTSDNRRNVAKLADYLHEQGFLPEVPEVDQLFVRQEQEPPPP